MAGQIYMPRVNWMLLIAVLFMVLLFKSSSNLAAAYGVAVTAEMVITSLIAFFVIWRMWGWTLWQVALAHRAAAAHRADVLHGEHAEDLRRRAGCRC